MPIKNVIKTATQNKNPYFDPGSIYTIYTFMTNYTYIAYIGRFHVL